MRYCGSFYNSHRLKGYTNYDEYKIKYKDNQDKLINFFRYAATGGSAVVIMLSDMDDLTDIILKNYLDKYIKETEVINFSFVLPAITNDNMKEIFLFIEELKERKIPYFFENKVSNIDSVWELIEYGASQVYICNDLCFELKQIHEKIHERGVKIRVYPDVAQSLNVFCEDIKKFFIRPDDIMTYEDYVDVCEFYQEDEGKLELLYEIYILKHRWHSNLGDIILGLDTEIHNAGVPKFFGERRSRCGRKCLKDGVCNACRYSIDLANTLEKMDSRII